jgi:hypothetical protein
MVSDMSLMDVAPLLQPDDGDECDGDDGDGDETINISQMPEVMSPSPVQPTDETTDREQEKI